MRKPSTRAEVGKSAARGDTEGQQLTLGLWASGRASQRK